MRISKDRIKNKNGIILTFGVLIRVFYFVVNLFVGGSNIDEAMTALNAGNLVNTFTDLNGERLPFYFDTWLYGGQSPFATYLTSLSVKLFGFNLFGIRFFALVLSIIGFMAFCGFVNEVFGNSRYEFVLKAFAAVSPWMIFSGVFVLDCNYIGHILIIALYFLARAVNGKGIINYTFSMAFFGLSFYCYMASVLFVPFVLLTVYAVLIIKKRISFTEVLLSVIAVTVVSLPFILFGFVSLGIIPEFKLLGFSFSKMDYYTRNSFVVFAGDSGAVGTLIKAVSNAAVVLPLMVYMNVLPSKMDLNSFQFATIIGIILSVMGFICVAFSAFKNRKKFTFIQKLFLFGMLVGVICFCMFVNSPGIDVLYRYGQLSYFIMPLVGIGFFEIIDNAKKANSRKVFIVLFSLSFLIFNGIFISYAANVNGVDDIVYGDSLYSCLEEAGEEETINLYCTDYYQPERVSIFVRYHYFDSNYDFSNFADEQIRRINGDFSSVELTTDKSIMLYTAEEKTCLTESFNIVPKENKEMFEFGDEYTVKDIGFWSVISK